MTFDVAILGGGPAGYSAAFEAVRHNMSVVLFERDAMGGTCLNRGCVPTKYLSHVARKYYELRTSETDGLSSQSLTLEFDKTQIRMKSIISSLRNGLEDQLNKSGINIISGYAEIVGGSLVVCNGFEYRAKNILIATGSAPVAPIVPNSITSNDILKLYKIPERLHIIGGGTVAVEFAEIFQMLGSDVAVSIRADRILRKWDKEIAVGVAHSMKKKGIHINKNSDFSAFDALPDEVILSAVGRTAVLPKTHSSLYEIGKTGGIVVDENGQTKTEGIFAAGDVIEGSAQLAHIAMEQGRRVVRFIAGEKVEKYFSVIQCIYLDQEIASVGLTETEAQEKGIEIVLAKQTMFSNARTMISTQERGFIKILAEKQSGKVVGAQLMCERAGDIVPELALAIDNGITVNKMLCSVRPHPSYSEAVTDTLRSLQEKLNAF